MKSPAFAAALQAFVFGKQAPPALEEALYVALHIGLPSATAEIHLLVSSGGASVLCSSATGVGKERLGIAPIARVRLVSIEQPVRPVRPINRAA